MKIKVSRKLKKELCKVDCLETTQPSIKTTPNPFSPIKILFTQYTRVKLKDDVKVNKCTKRLVRNILREVKRNHRHQIENAMKRQIAWPDKYTADDLRNKMRGVSQEQFRREYLCEPEIKSLPSIVEFQDGERIEWQPNNQREVEEYIKRCNLQPYIQELDGNGIAILKLPSLSPEQIKKFKEEWQKFARSSQPIISVDHKASIEFIPSKRPHRLHNHPRMEVQYDLDENKVIVDDEFIYLFSISNSSRIDREHWIVDKEEFLKFAK